MKAKKVSDTAVLMAMQMQPSDANPMGNVHGGVIMKHIDSAGGAVCQRHAGNLAVTASIDRLDFFRPVYVGNMLVLKASLNLAGTTSMEAGVRVEAEDLLTGEVRHCVSAYLTFVALDPETGKPCRVPPLELVTEDEKRRNREAMERRKVRLAEKERERKNRR